VLGDKRIAAGRPTQRAFAPASSGFSFNAGMFDQTAGTALSQICFLGRKTV